MTTTLGLVVGSIQLGRSGESVADWGRPNVRRLGVNPRPLTPGVRTRLHSGFKEALDTPRRNWPRYRPGPQSFVEFVREHCDAFNLGEGFRDEPGYAGRLPGTAFYRLPTPSGMRRSLQPSMVQPHVPLRAAPWHPLIKASRTGCRGDRPRGARWPNVLECRPAISVMSCRYMRAVSVLSEPKVNGLMSEQDGPRPRRRHSRMVHLQASFHPGPARWSGPTRE